MTEGTSQGTMVLIAIIIFGIFVLLAYWLFEDQIKSMLVDMMSSTDDIVQANLDQVTTDAGLGRGPGTP